MPTKFQVFVSSTYEDLQAERRIVIEQILNMGHIPVGMESFNAADDTQWAYIQRRIDESDYYVVIIAERYGAEDGGVSYTRKEYEYAIKKEKPVAAFLLGSDGRRTWPAQKVDFANREKLESFRELCKSRMVKFWNNGDQLGTAVVLSLTELINTKPGIGWIRGDSLPANVVSEMASLSQEKRMLSEQVDKLRSQISDAGRLPAEVEIRINDLQSEFVMISDRQFGGDSTFTKTDYTALDMFLRCHKFLATGVTDSALQYKIGREFIGTPPYGIAIERLLGEWGANKLIDVKISSEMRFDKLTSVSYYTLSEYGKDFVHHALRWLAEHPEQREVDDSHAQDDAPF